VNCNLNKLPADRCPDISPSPRQKGAKGLLLSNRGDYSRFVYGSLKGKRAEAVSIESCNRVMIFPVHDRCAVGLEFCHDSSVRYFINCKRGRLLRKMTGLACVAAIIS
jgi:hypothetical protein